MNSNARGCFKRQASLCVLALALAACGGGGGGGSGGSGGGTPPPPPPIVSAQSFNGTEDTALSATIQTIVTSGATLTVEQTSQPQNGTITAFAANGTFTYQPNANAFGADTFTVRASDSAGKTGTATITLNIANVNDAPVATNDRFVLASASSIDLDVLSNDSDVETQALSVELVTAAAGEPSNPEVGTAQVAANQHIIVSFPSEFRGVTRLRYRVKDQDGGMSDVSTAVAFVGTQPFEMWYLVDGVVYAHNLLQARQISTFEAPSRSGRVKFSTDKGVAVIEEVRDDRVAALVAVPTRGTEAPQLLTQPLASDEAISTYLVNTDGSWTAYVIEKTSGERSLWLVALEAPAERQEVVLPETFMYFEQEMLTSPMTFNTAGTALYFVARNENGVQRLYRAPVSDPAQPIAVIADPDPVMFSWVGTYFLDPTETYVVADLQVGTDFGLHRVSLADPTERTRLSPPGAISSIVANETVTRVAYNVFGDSNAYTDDTVFAADVSTTPNWTEYVAADAARTGPLQPVTIGPDGQGVLIQDWSKVGDVFHIDLSEALGDGSLNIISVAPAAGTTSSSTNAVYGSTGDSVIYQWTSSFAPWRLIETRRGSFDEPIDLVAPGVVYPPVFSKDLTMLATTHSYNVSGNSIFRVRLVNRGVPGAMIDLTSGQTVPHDIAAYGFVEEPEAGSE